MWAHGLKVDWSLLYTGERRCRVSLPYYPFERNEFKLPSIQGGNADSPSLAVDESSLKRKKQDIADWFYMPAWKRTVPAAFMPNEKAENETDCWVLFADEYGVAAQMQTQLRETGARIVSVLQGDSYVDNSVPEDHTFNFIINPREREDYIQLLQAIKAQGMAPVRIADMWNLSPQHKGLDLEQCQNGQYASFYAPLYLQQALVSENVLDRVRLLFVTNNTFSVSGEKVICPEKALLVGPARVFYHEYPDVQCHLVDIDLPLNEQGEIDQYNQQVANYLIAETDLATDGKLVAYRSGCRWEEEYQAVRLHEQVSGISAEFKDEGVYLITGGLGGLGMLVAGHISELCNATLVLTYRSSLPAREEWQAWIEQHPVDDAMSEKLVSILRLEEMGNTIDLVQVDVCDYAEMEKMCQRYPRFDGIFHTAGIAGGGIIPLKSDQDCASVIDPKLTGSLILDELTKDNQPDFMVLFSSITSIQADEARIDYCAGNAFLDTYASYRNQNRNGRTISINWGKWGDVGMAVQYGRELMRKSAAGST